MNRPPHQLNSVAPNSCSVVQLEDGMWALRGDQPISVEVVNEAIDALRRERERCTLG